MAPLYRCTRCGHTTPWVQRFDDPDGAPVELCLVRCVPALREFLAGAMLQGAETAPDGPRGRIFEATGRWPSNTDEELDRHRLAGRRVVDQPQA